jgi:hypothetical protein
MKKVNSFFLIVLIHFLNTSFAHAAFETTDFSSFYKESLSIWWAVAVLFSVIAVIGVIIGTGGTASPIVLSIGTWVGNLMGLSGVAATNAGLALLGGGSLASGGFGVLGGTVVLTAVFTFSQDVIIDYGFSKVYTEYKYHSFVNDSKNMTTIPLPKNTEGPDVYEKALVILENIDKEAPYSSYENNLIINKAFDVLPNNILNEEDYNNKEMARIYTLKSLLLFNLFRYHEAKDFALKGIIYSRKAEKKRTLPAFIYAVSSLYDEEFNFNKTSNDFSYSLFAEPDNKLIPLMFSVYLDRLLFRLNDGSISSKTLEKIYEFAIDERIEDFKKENLIILVARYFMLIKLNQQRILSLTKSKNDKIKSNPITLINLQDFIKRYEYQIERTNLALDEINKIEDLSSKDNKNISKFQQLLSNYEIGIEKLKIRILIFEASLLINVINKYIEKIENLYNRIITLTKNKDHTLNEYQTTVKVLSRTVTEIDKLFNEQSLLNKMDRSEELNQVLTVGQKEIIRKVYVLREQEKEIQTYVENYKRKKPNKIKGKTLESNNSKKDRKIIVANTKSERNFPYMLTFFSIIAMSIFAIILIKYKKRRS